METFDASHMSFKKRYHQELMPSITRARMTPSRNNMVQPLERNVKSNMTDFRKSVLSLMDRTRDSDGGNFMTINKHKLREKIFIGDLDPSQFKHGP
jgi:hypothetical protein